jgi:2-polyprenyl-3-methyl-5-hydroxy-6-metoxy-1,4-benzoquinol methylase
VWTATLGDNACQHAPMTADDQTTHAAAGPAAQLRGARGRLRALARRYAARLAGPYVRQRTREAHTAATVARMQAELDHVSVRHAEQIARLEDLVRELILAAESLRRGISHADTTATWARRTIEPIAADLRALPYMEGSPFEPMSSPVGEALGFRAPLGIAPGTSEYTAFEDLFRGSTERVADSQRPYLTLVSEHQPVLDIGCGRGEFLAQMAAEGIVATGVDSDPGMVERCRALGLETTLTQANDHLESLDDGTLGAIFSAQVIEHLPHEELQRMLALALRKLRPGGLFIAETVNPHRISSLKTFWVDLTHQHPIFPEVALATCAIAGFESAYVFAPGFDSFEAARFESPAYAVVATAPQAARTEAQRAEEQRG